ncbi:MAG: DUF4350 domain-containing protein [Candidatus Heimdallarchaeota archaeon]
MAVEKENSKPTDLSAKALQIIIRRSVVFVIILIVLFFPFFVPLRFSPSLSDHGGWNGTSTFRNRLQEDYTVKTILTSPTVLNEDVDPGLLIIVGAERAYSIAEIRAIEYFLLRGGSLLICDDFGPGRAVASHFGVDFLSGKVLETRDQRFITDPRFPIVTIPDEAREILDIEAERILLNDASAISIFEEDWDTVLTTSNTAFLDADNDGKFDSYEDRDFFTVFAANWNESIAVIADSSIVTNEMLSLTDFHNYQFIKSVIDRLIAPHEAILIEDSHRNWIPVGGRGYLATILGWSESIIFSPIYVIAFALAFGGVLVLPLVLEKHSQRKKPSARYLPIISGVSHHPKPLSVEEEIITGLIASNEVLGLNSFLHLYSELLLDSLEGTEAYKDNEFIQSFLKRVRETLASPLRPEEYYAIISHLYNRIEVEEGSFMEDFHL